MSKVSFLKVKVCGMVNQQNSINVSMTSPDYLGFIFYESSPRYVGEKFSIPNALSDNIKRVGVFVNEAYDEILEKVKKHNLDFVQLHGDEDPLFCKKLKTVGVAVIKAFAIDEFFDFKYLSEYSNYVSFFLFDTKGKSRGGTGRSFDWSLLKKYDQKIPFILSGGIGIEEVDQIERLSNLNIHGIDVNSKLELKPGIKDVNKVDELLKRLRQL